MATGLNGLPEHGTGRTDHGGRFHAALDAARSYWVEIVFGVVLWILTAPELFRLPGVDPDSNGIIGLSMASVRGFDFATKVASTYGPLGHLEFAQLVYRSPWIQSVIALVVFHAFFIATFVWFLHRCRIRRIWWPLLGATLLAAAAPAYPLEQGVTTRLESELAVATCLLGIVALLGPCRKRLPILIGAVGAFQIMIKGTSGTSFVLVLATLALAGLVLHRHELWWAVASAAVAVPVLWTLAGQPLGGIPTFLSNTLAVESSYSSAMVPNIGTPLPGGGFILLLGFACIIGLAVHQSLTQGVHTVWPYILIVITSFVYYKEGVVRNDAFHIYAAPCLIAVVLVGLIGIGSYSGLRIPLRVALTVLAVFTIYSVGVLVHVARIPPRVIATSGITHIQDYPTVVGLLAHPERTAADVLFNQAILRGAYGVPREMLHRIGSSSVAVWPVAIGVAYASGLNWDPIPILQSYGIWNPELDRLAAQSLTGPSAPRYILWSNQSIDGVNVSTNGPEFTRTLWHTYHPVERAANGWVLLERTPLPLTSTYLGSVTAPFGSWVSVPTTTRGSIVTAAMAIEPTLTEKIATTIVRGRPVWVQWQLADGSTASTRIQPATAVGGLIVSNLPQTASEFALFQCGIDVASVKRFRVLADPISRFRSPLHIRFVGRSQPRPSGCR